VYLIKSPTKLDKNQPYYSVVWNDWMTRVRPGGAYPLIVSWPYVQLAIISRARACIGTSAYVYHSEKSRPPLVVNCHTFLWWVFNWRVGRFPWNFSQQLYFGEPLPRSHARTCDLVFRRGCRWNMKDSRRATLPVGHVGILTPGHNVIHACHDQGTVVEEPMAKYANGGPECDVVYRFPT